MLILGAWLARNQRHRTVSEVSDFISSGETVLSPIRPFLSPRCKRAAYQLSVPVLFAPCLDCTPQITTYSGDRTVVRYLFLPFFCYIRSSRSVRLSETTPGLHRVSLVARLEDVAEYFGRIRSRYNATELASMAGFQPLGIVWTNCWTQNHTLAFIMMTITITPAHISLPAYCTRNHVDRLS